jgi:alkanesulfonate monooxygenase SsuD/methylene tetrahydromethanopterin reductase-like flavin-dependent oxidoreductase (luciferase family)
VEGLGFDTLWVIEDCFLSGGLTLAAMALAATESIGVGVGLLPAPLRNPALTAMEIGTLARAHPGRFEATLGHGVAKWMEQVGALPSQRTAHLAETASAVRRLLAGETVTISGTHVKFSEVALEQPPDPAPPLLIGTTGPMGFGIAARTADGILLPEGCGPEFVKWALDQIPTPCAPRCVVYSWFSIDDDPDRARRRLMPAIDLWLESDHYPHPRRAAGAVQPPPRDSAARLALTDRVSVCGDAETCAGTMARLADAGADTVVLVGESDGLDAQLERFAGEVMPLLARS